jgi:hypothetical protein
MIAILATWTLSHKKKEKQNIGMPSSLVSWLVKFSTDLSWWYHGYDEFQTSWMRQTPWPQKLATFRMYYMSIKCAKTQACGDILPPQKNFKIGKIWRLIFEKKRDFSLEIWISITFWWFFAPKKKKNCSIVLS